MRRAPFPVCRVLRSPDCVRGFSIGDWETLIRQARAGGLLGRLALLLESTGLDAVIPQSARWHFDAAHTLADRQRIAVHWEIEQLRRALRQLDTPLVALKGAAYVIADLPPAQGRLFSDVDLLVRRDRLDAAEAALMLAGWHATGSTPYDERYYRQWMHEIPPLTHVKRGSALDLHHAILPLTARPSVATDALLARIEPVAAYPGVFVLGREDRVLHSATHLFHDGELDHGLRDLSDLHLLLTDPANPEAFWPGLLDRADDLGLGRDLAYAVRFARHFLDTPVPEHALQALKRYLPRWRMRLTDAVFRRALAPRHPSCDDRYSDRARAVAYVRAHWLRMPPHLLIPHLLHKALISPLQKPDRPEAA